MSQPPPPPYGGDPNQPYGQQPPGQPPTPPPPGSYGGGGYQPPQPPQPPPSYQAPQPPQQQYQPPPPAGSFGGGAYQPPVQYGADGTITGRRNNTLALVSMIVGIASIVVCCLGTPAGIVAVVLGFIARNQINQSGGSQGGSGMALTGIITGGVAIVLGVVVIVLDLAGAFAHNLSGY